MNCLSSIPTILDLGDHQERTYILSSPIGDHIPGEKDAFNSIKREMELNYPELDIRMTPKNIVVRVPKRDRNQLSEHERLMRSNGRY